MKKESFSAKETCGDRFRIEQAGRLLNKQVAILADQPPCIEKLGEQPSALPLPAAACNSAGR